MNRVSLRALNHITRATHNVDRLVHFYGEVIGLPQVQRPNALSQSPGAWFAMMAQQHDLPPGASAPSGTITLHILPAEREDHSIGLIPKGISSLSARRHHIAFSTPDIERSKMVLDTHEIPYTEVTLQLSTAEAAHLGLDLQQSTIRQLFFCDPDGNELEITTMPERSLPFIEKL